MANRPPKPKTERKPDADTRRRVEEYYRALIARSAILAKVGVPPQDIEDVVNELAVRLLDGARALPKTSYDKRTGHNYLLQAARSIAHSWYKSTFRRAESIEARQLFETAELGRRMKRAAEELASADPAYARLFNSLFLSDSPPRTLHQLASSSRVQEQVAADFLGELVTIASDESSRHCLRVRQEKAE